MTSEVWTAARYRQEMGLSKGVESERAIARRLGIPRHAVKRLASGQSYTPDPLDKKWTTAEENLLRETWMSNLGHANGSLNDLALQIGRNSANLSRKAKALGLPKSGPRKPDPAWMKKLQQGLSLYIHRHGYPHQGKQHSISSRKLMSMKASERIRANRDVHNGAGKTGKRADLGGRYFRSRWEANYARFLSFIGIKWEYESKTFWFHKIKRGTRSYTPDFFLPKISEYHEVKGWMDKKSKTRLNRMKKYYPDVKIVIIGKEFFQEANKKRLCRLIPHWECEHRHSILISGIKKVGLDWVGTSAHVEPV